MDYVKQVVPWEVHLGKIEYGRIKRVPESLACVWTPPPLRKSGIFFERGGGVYTKDTESLTLELCVLVKSGEMELFENEQGTTTAFVKNVHPGLKLTQNRGLTRYRLASKSRFLVHCY